jgi:SRSO17 transposase
MIAVGPPQIDKRNRIPEKGQPFGRRDPAILRTGGQTGELPCCREFVSCHLEQQSSYSVAALLARDLASDPQKREKAGIPEQIQFETKPMIALEQIRQAVADGVAPGVVVADAGYGVDGRFRKGVTELQLEYVVGVQSSASVWEPGKQPLPAKPYSGTGRPPRLLRRDKDHKPVSVKQLALMLPAQQWKTVNWRQGTKHNLRSRFAAVRIRPAHRDDWQAEPHPEEWLLIEWPKGEAEPAKYWLSTLPAATKLKQLVALAKQRWIIEQNYEELKQELGLGHFEGRGWRGFHHHATLCIAAYGFLVAERSRFSPSAHAGNLGLSAPALPQGFRPRGSSPTRAA